eukprot:5471454-Pleurochrysis_carterae.AAC.1
MRKGRIAAATPRRQTEDFPDVFAGSEESNRSADSLCLLRWGKLRTSLTTEWKSGQSSEWASRYRQSPEDFDAFMQVERQSAVRRP